MARQSSPTGSTIEVGGEPEQAGSLSTHDLVNGDEARHDPFFQGSPTQPLEFDRVLQSEIGVNTLLMRLKQSIASAREFAAFLKKRSTLEEEQAQGLKKLCKHTSESTRRPDSRQGSYARNYEEITRIHDRMADNGIQFALSLHQMNEDLTELAGEKERGRKQWKQSGLSAEKRVQDAELATEKAKLKYDALAEDFDRARTGDKQSGRVFGLKGPKSAAQVEEDLNRKVQAADADYSSKVQLAQGMRNELISTSRPQAVKALQELINECDAGLLLQMQKFASFNEKLLLSNGICISPLKAQSSGGGLSARSLRDVIYSIDNERDLRSYISTFFSRVATNRPELKYERHPTLQTTHPSSNTTSSNRQNLSTPKPQALQFPLHVVNDGTSQASPSRPNDHGQEQSTHRADLSPDFGSAGSSRQQTIPVSIASGLGSSTNTAPLSSQHHAQSTPIPNNPASPLQAELPPLKPVFGMSLEDLFSRDGSAVPIVVHQCLQAVDLFGLEVEGIYRTSGTTSHISKLRAFFDNDSLQVDFRNPENFFHDVNSVAGLLKQFLRDLPDPLLTRDHYQGFIEAARIDDDTTRRDSLHATINSLPDPNYATLRALTLHLNRVQEHSAANRMNAGNLAICFGPTLMGSNTGPNVADAGWQVRVIDTILQNTYQIFDED